ncbi:MAG: ABC transporter substrate-binding protein, partial [Deinococcota bacterium]
VKYVIMGSVALLLSTGAAQSADDTYVYMSFGEIDTLDPAEAYDTSSGTVLENVYETLYAYDGDSITDYVPSLAVDHSISADGLTYTYTLREGVTFHSGNPMSCKDVEYSIERGLVTNAPGSGIWFQAEALLGTDSNANDDDSITYAMIDGAVTCPDGDDGLTVQFNLPAVDPAFFVKLMYTNASVVDMVWAVENGMWDGTEDTWRDWVGVDLRESYMHNHVSGTGAYRLVEWDGTNTVAEAYDGYWGEQPEIQNVLLQIVDEESTRILALQQGDADRIAVNTWGTVEAQIRGLDGVTIHEDPAWTSLSVGALHMNQDVVTADNAANVGSGELDGSGVPADFFADPNVRLGFAYSFDPDQFLEQLYLGKGVVLTMALPPTFLGYDPDVPVYTYDPERAEDAFRAALDGELWDTGFEITLSYNTGNTVRQTITEILKQNIEDLNPNFIVNVRGIQWPDFLADRQAGKLPLSIVGWAPDYADPDNYMYTFYHSGGFYGGLLNYQNAEIDSLLEDARATTDTTERELLYNTVASLAYEDVPFIPYPTRQAFIVSRADVDGVYYNPMLSHQYLWKEISK